MASADVMNVENAEEERSWVEVPLDTNVELKAEWAFVSN